MLDMFLQCLIGHVLDDAFGQMFNVRSEMPYSFDTVPCHNGKQDTGGRCSRRRSSLRQQDDYNDNDEKVILKMMITFCKLINPSKISNQEAKVNDGVDVISKELLFFLSEDTVAI